MSAQAELFEIEAPTLPQGLRYREDVLSPGQERFLVCYIAQLPLQPFEFAGGFKGNRRVLSFGFRYDYHQQQLIEAVPIPRELDEIRRTVALWSGHDPAALRQALVTEYAPGAGIGWHRDKKMFGDVIGLSLLAPCTFRLRRRLADKLGGRHGDKWQRVSLEAAPRSAYVLSGQARNVWEHSIPPLERLRYSITFRTFAA